jgi:glycosyltransferase involved in cell wall biosynthesis
VSQTSTVPRVAFAMAGNPVDRDAFSGLPASFCTALAQLGVTVVPIDVLLPRPWQRVVVNVMTFGFLDPSLAMRSWRAERSVRRAFRSSKPKLHPSREMAAIRSAVAAFRLQRSGPVDRAISWGSEFHLPAGTDYVTLDDATIVQLRRSYQYEWMQAVSEGSLARMIARQWRIFHRARACCTLTHWAAASAVSDYKIAPERVHVVGLGPNRDVQPTERDWSTPRFLFVGKEFSRKNGPTLLRAFSELRSYHPAATLDIVGDHPRLDQEGVTGHGPLTLNRPTDVTKVNELFGRATCFVMPSLFEPAGMVFAEALAAGIGSIGPQNGGSATIIGDAGVTVPGENLGLLTQEMLRFCDPVEARTFGANARARAPLFTWRATAERVVRALALPGYENHGLAEPL